MKDESRRRPSCASRAAWSWVLLISSFVLTPSSFMLDAAAPPPGGEDEQLLHESRVPTDGPGLLAFVRQRFTSTVSQAKIKDLIEQLGDDSFEKRQNASHALTAAGRHAKGALQLALTHEDLEIRDRAERCLREIGHHGPASRLTAAALRVLARRAPPGTTALLLDLLPSQRLEPIAPSIRKALAMLAVRDGKTNPDLVAAMGHRLAVTRYAAAEALIHARAEDQLPALRKLLGDPDDDVRLDVALGLARWGQKEAISPLIAALSRPITPRYGQVEEVLHRLAGQKAPTLAGDDQESRDDYRKAWERWWRENRARVDLATLEGPAKLLGRTAVVLLDDNQVLDLDEDDRVRWKIDGVEMPLDIQPLAGDRVLLAEYKGNRVTERNRKGKVVWEKHIPEPLMAQRLPDGHTVIASKNHLVEVDRAGREVFTYSPEGGAEIMRARRLTNGDTVLITQLAQTQLVRLDAFGNVTRRFPVDVGTSGGRLDVSLAGNVLVPEMYSNRIAEYDDDGKVVRQVVVAQPIACVALPNGHLVITLMTQKRAVELDRGNKEVWEYRRDTRVTRAVRY